MTPAWSVRNSRLLAIAACLTTATQLRPESVPVGLGESLLVIWIVVAALQGPRFGSFRTAETLSSAWLIFWLVSGSALTAGAIFGHLLGRLEPAPALRDALAFALAGAACVVSARQAGDSEWVATTRSSFAVSVTVAGVLLGVAAFAIGTVGPVRLWFMDVRFTGWARNPNQFALLLVPIPFFAIRIAGGLQSAAARVSVRLIVIVAVLAVGLMTLSDALFLAWMVGGAVLATAAARKVFRDHGTPTFKLLLGVLVGILALLLAGLYGSRVLASLQDYAESVYSAGAQGSERVRLWANGLRAIYQSPLVGLGPGPHSGQYGPFEGMEAHNSLVDWIGMTGLLGGTAFVCLAAYLVLTSQRSGQDVAMTAGLIATLAFCIFHFVFRQPIFWIYLVLLCATVRPRSSQGMGS